eukprot:GHVL01035745.1.p1 GENE.GHVL01035745.1~~GHVL01035745.1.p1  ORF type:complete len:287 (-),score=50.97 GHVL01035745.1:853-1713(-)
MKERLESRINDLTEQLESEEHSHRTQLRSFEEAKHSEMEKFKTYFAEELTRKNEFLKMTEDESTKQTLIEHGQVCKELQYQSRETVALVNENNELIRENHDLKSRLSLSIEREKKLAKKLIKPFDSPEKSLKICNRTLVKPPSDIIKDERQLVLVGEQEKHIQEISRLQDTLRVIRKEFRSYKQDHDTIKMLSDEAVKVLCSAMMDLQKGNEEISRNDSSIWGSLKSYEKMSFLEGLLEKLTVNCTSQLTETKKISLPNIPGAISPIKEDRAKDLANFLLDVVHRK